MRGYYEGRYRDKKLLAMQTEYRIPIIWRFGAALFAGAGDVAPALSKFNLSSVKPSYGFGLRYLFDPVEKMCIRIDFGFGKGTSGMYITANEAYLERSAQTPTLPVPSSLSKRGRVCHW